MIINPALWRSIVSLQISYQGKTWALGDYDTEELAARAFDRALICKNGKEAQTNYPVQDYEDEFEKLQGMFQLLQLRHASNRLCSFKETSRWILYIQKQTTSIKSEALHCLLVANLRIRDDYGADPSDAASRAAANEIIYEK